MPIKLLAQNNIGFVEYDVFSLSPEALVNYSSKINRAQSWEVIIRNDSIKFVKERPKKEKMSFPPNLERGSTASLKVFNGWLVGRDTGEFGGDFKWYSADGKTIETLNIPIVHDIVICEDKILALTGLQHMSSNYGTLIHLFFENNKWQYKAIYDFIKYPYVFATDPDQNLYVILSGNTNIEVVFDEKTQKGHEELHERSKLIKFDKDMHIQMLINDGFWTMAYPNSMVYFKGSIYIGMRGGALKVTLKNGKVIKEWFENYIKAYG